VIPPNAEHDVLERLRDAGEQCWRPLHTFEQRVVVQRRYGEDQDNANELLETLADLLRDGNRPIGTEIDNFGMPVNVRTIQWLRECWAAMRAAWAVVRDGLRVEMDSADLVDLLTAYRATAQTAPTADQIAELVRTVAGRPSVVMPSYPDPQRSPDLNTPETFIEFCAACELPGWDGLHADDVRGAWEHPLPVYTVAAVAAPVAPPPPAAPTAMVTAPPGLSAYQVGQILDTARSALRRFVFTQSRYDDVIASVTDRLGRDPTADEIRTLRAAAVAVNVSRVAEHFADLSSSLLQQRGHTVNMATITTRLNTFFETARRAWLTPTEARILREPSKLAYHLFGDIFADIPVRSDVTTTDHVSTEDYTHVAVVLVEKVVPFLTEVRPEIPLPPERLPDGPPYDLSTSKIPWVSHRPTPRLVWRVAMRFRAALEQGVNSAPAILDKADRALTALLAQAAAMRTAYRSAVIRKRLPMVPALLSDLSTVYSDVTGLARETAAAIGAAEAKLATTRDIYIDLMSLRKDNGNLRLDFQNACVETTLGPIILVDEGSGHTVNLGYFTLRLAWSTIAADRQAGAAVFIVVAENPVYPTDSDGATRNTITHPNIMNESMCSGEGTESIRVAINQGRIGDAFDLATAIVRTYGAASPFRSLASWKGHNYRLPVPPPAPPPAPPAPTADPGRTNTLTPPTIRVPPDPPRDTVTCTVCHRPRTRVTTVTCATCASAICPGCAASCGTCEASVCLTCAARCPVCERIACGGCRQSVIDVLIPTTPTVSVCQGCARHCDHCDRDVPDDAYSMGRCLACEADATGVPRVELADDSVPPAQPAPAGTATLPRSYGGISHDDPSDPDDSGPF